MEDKDSIINELESIIYKITTRQSLTDSQSNLIESIVEKNDDKIY